MDKQNVGLNSENEKDGKDMVLRQEEILRNRQVAEGNKNRKARIRTIANRVCDRNDKALRRLAKS
ncbi:MAG: hypothetical protein K6T63_10270 [Alicyclobacillus herbarius]|uniref:hypothetical protein n=1 Tax=Alicyclobacillus herbarius TaxID=122960 RepID=UPI00042A365E|nr:hypothetical protein [Alicyclobacillus herbarius]MCL6633006.1 hypothetical protein [Alicyclobacillus herbarius]